MNQYRCTRPGCYEKGCPGHTDPSARQGHYIYAETREDAIEQMIKRFPDDVHFDIQLWKEGVAP